MLYVKLHINSDYTSSLKEMDLIEIDGNKISITQKGKEYIQAHNI